MGNYISGKHDISIDWQITWLNENIDGYQFNIEVENYTEEVICPLLSDFNKHDIDKIQKCIQYFNIIVPYPLDVNAIYFNISNTRFLKITNINTLKEKRCPTCAKIDI
jgi:hypothetical protein